MTGRFVTSGGGQWALPPLLEWRVTRTGTVPCDDFTVTCVCTPEMPDKLRQAVEFLIWEDGTLRLRGFVDEYVITESREGRLATVTGRGMAGRLLDNESRPMTYQGATLREILRNHAEPYGIACGELADIGTRSEYRVSAGLSQWRAVDDFCRTYGGFSPRFTADGRLLAAPERNRRTLLLDGNSRLLKLTKRENRYGVLSEVLVIDKVQGAEHSVRNQDFLSRGGCRRRVLYTPGQSTWAAMRYTGEYQIARSREDETVIEAVLPGASDVEPGDIVALRRPGCGLSGDYRAAEAERALSSNGETTTLTLKEQQK